MSLESAQQGRASRDVRHAITVTEDDLNKAIVSELYFTGADGVFGAVLRVDGTLPPPADDTPLAQLTFCVLQLDNGFAFVGINHGPAVKSGFDPAYGRQDARNDAVRKAMPFLGFRLADAQAKTVLTADDAIADLLGEPRPERGAMVGAGHAEPQCAVTNPIDDAVREVRAAISRYEAAHDQAVRTSQLATEKGDAFDEAVKDLAKARRHLNNVVGRTKDEPAQR